MNMKILTSDEVKRLRLNQVSVITVDMLEGYNVIEEGAFKHCEFLTSVIIPNSVTSIGDFAFVGCKSLTSVTIPNSVTNIGKYAFSWCFSLTSVDIPNSVTSIETHTFHGCSSLSSITIPNSVTSIGEYAFENCSSLTSVTITDIAAWCNIDFENYSANPLRYTHKLYLNGELVKDLVIPNSVISIRDFAFYGCFSLTSVTIPNSVTSIGNSAFYQCKSLTSVIIPNSVTNIGNGAFNYCSSLTSITIPNNVTSIRDYTFSHCSGLTSVVIPNSVTSIDYSAFQCCTSLTSITIPDSVTSIGGGAFQYCSKLTSVTIGNGVTSIGYYAFYYCPSLISINVDVNNPNYFSVDGVLFNKNETTIIQYPIGNTRSEFTIPNGVTSIGELTFYGCKYLTSITIPNSVRNIVGEIFWDCFSLTSVTIGDKTYEQQNIVEGKCKAYKGFKPDLICRDYQYKEGETFIMEEPIEICKQGFHACLKLTDVFNYYNGEIGKDFVIHEVELENVQTDNNHTNYINNDSKVVAKKITIGKRIL